MTPVDYLKILCQIVEAGESFGPAIVAAEQEGLIDEVLKARIVAATSDLWQIEKRLKVDRKTADDIGLQRMAVWGINAPTPAPLWQTTPRMNGINRTGDPLSWWSSRHPAPMGNGPVAFVECDSHRDKDIT